MKTKKISSAIAKAIGVLWIALLTGVIITYTTSCSKSGKRVPKVEQNTNYVGSSEYYELLEAIAIIDDINANESDEFYTEMFNDVTKELNHILYEKISE